MRFVQEGFYLKQIANIENLIKFVIGSRDASIQAHTLTSRQIRLQDFR